MTIPNLIGLVLLLALGTVLAIWLIRVHFFSKARIFTIEMVGELKKASWPSRLELRDSTIVVIVATIVLGLFTSICDFALTQVVNLFTELVR